MKQLLRSTREKEKNERIAYEAPTIIFKGKISTRAGSPLSVQDGAVNGVDPADLFGND